jgi:peptidoglycan hydrolase-like protein with peptidoglycan-binding domain
LKKNKGNEAERSRWGWLVPRVLLRRPLESLAVVAAVAAVGAVSTNALFLQDGPHPAPIFTLAPIPVTVASPVPARSPPPASAAPEPTGTVPAILPRPRPADLPPRADGTPSRSRKDIVVDLQRELSRRGFYDGPIDGIYGGRINSAIRDFEHASGVRYGGEPNEAFLQAVTRSGAKSASSRSGTVTLASAQRSDPIAELIGPSKKVAAVQRALSEYGFGQIQATGVMNPETETAIQKFERDRKLPVTGQVSDRLLRDLTGITGRPLD